MHRVWYVERGDWFGDYEQVAEFATEREARAHARQLQRASDAVDDPDDRVRYSVGSYTPAPILPHHDDDK